MKTYLQYFYNSSFIFLAILVTGGYGDNRRSVEALWSNGSSLCSLPDLPDDHSVHTQSGLVTCGGYYDYNTQTSCYTFTNGVWTKSHTLRYGRYQHSSWTSPMGIVLMGGWDSDSETTTELLTDDGQSTENFSLRYITE